jgi:hypothetical protein
VETNPIERREHAASPDVARLTELRDQLFALRTQARTLGEEGLARRCTRLLVDVAAAALQRGVMLAIG